MLLFVLAVGLAVTLGLMNFINLAHGAFAMAGGYITVLLMQRAGVPFLVCLPIAFAGAALLGAVLERTLYRPLYAQAAPGPGAVLDRPGLHGGRRGRLLRRLARSRSSSCPAGCKGRTEIGSVVRWAWATTASSSSPSARALTVRAAVRSCRARASAAGCAPRSTTSASPAGLGINVNVVFLLDLRLRLGPGRPRRRARRRSARARPDLPAQVHDLFPDRRRGRRHLVDHRPAARRAAARHRRRRRQVLHPQAGRLHRLQR